ncbi:Caleosin-domain-containing protein [Lophium mytilinum]|uniref:Caleosin-domain-containing protein n=1 Tax=Lophium mytilinum TaxID=390894 RepID=A0A6A6QAR6_9PEZI|nr:Caleosin-domain-containing protein [Lophium mytilinum]
MISLKEPSNETSPTPKKHLDDSTTYATSLPTVPITLKRPPYIPTPHSSALTNAGVARANIAASAESPNGTTTNNWAGRHAHQTVLQQHCAFFDRDGDGVIWPRDTWHSFRELGFSWPIALFGAYIIHAALSYPTQSSLLPDPCFRIWVDGVHRDKHGSGSMSYDAEGRFRPQQFEDFFAKYDKEGKGGLTKGDVATALRGQALAFDVFGGTAAALEWTATYLLLWPDDGVMKKDDVRRIFDGSIFYQKAEEYRGKKLKGGSKVAA